MPFNAEAYKQAFRKRAHEMGIDPERGLTDAQYAARRPTSYNVALWNARQRKALHGEVMQQKVFAAAERQYKRGIFFTEGRGFLKDNRDLDTELLGKMTLPNWWKALHPDDWKPGMGSSATERQALRSIRQACAAGQRKTLVTQQDLIDDLSAYLKDTLKERPMILAMGA